MKRSMIQGHGEEGWGNRGSRFDRGRVIAPEPGAIAPELSVDEFSRFPHVGCASSESRSDPELRVSYAARSRVEIPRAFTPSTRDPRRSAGATS